MSSSTPHQTPDNFTTLRCTEEASEVLHSDFDTRKELPPSDESTVDYLIDSETHFLPSPDYLHRCRHRPVDVTARQDSINWILKVHAHYRFSPVTALLSVNYLDRFLSSQILSFPANGWAFQLLSVACLSLAAKMEEPEVPLLADLQVLEPGFVFESKTIQRMELLVMSRLDWRLRSTTPFDYLNPLISKLPSSSFDFRDRLFTSSCDLILNTTRVIDFLGFTPSTVATAAVLCAVAGERDNVLAAEGSCVSCVHQRMNEEMVRSCRQLMEEYLVDTCPSARLKVSPTALSPADPSSPVAVLDAAVCQSCETLSENNPLGGSSSRANIELPVTKRVRSSESDLE